MSKLEKPNLELARKIVERFLLGDDGQLGQDAYYMFLVSKFILLEERIIKKDCSNKILHFDNIKYKKFIPIILDFYKAITSNGSFLMDDRTTIILEGSRKRNDELIKAIWCFHKIRDALAHGESNYSFDFENKSIVISTRASDGSYYLNCNIPIYLFNAFSFFIEDKITDNSISINKHYNEYTRYLKSIFNVDKNLFNNQYINKYNFNIKKFSREIINSSIMDNDIGNQNIKKFNNDYYDFYYRSLPKKNKRSFNPEIEQIINKKADTLNIDDVYRLYQLILTLHPRDKQDSIQIINLLKK